MERKECDCKRCQSACLNVPGWFLPGEAARAAAAAGLQLDEYFRRYLIVDYWLSSDGGDIFALRPATMHEEPGTVAEFVPAKAACRFLRSDDCRRCHIHAVKPHECGVWVHGMDHDGMHEATAMAWRDHQDEIVALLGYHPSVPEPTVGDMTALMFR